MSSKKYLGRMAKWFSLGRKVSGPHKIELTVRRPSDDGVVGDRDPRRPKPSPPSPWSRSRATGSRRRSVGADLAHHGDVTNERRADRSPTPGELGLPEHSALTMEGRVERAGMV